MNVFNFMPFKLITQPIIPTAYDDSLSYYECINKLVYNINYISDCMNKLTNALVSPYTSEKSYKSGDYCWYENKLYKCVNANYGTWNFNDWEEVVFVDNITERFNDFIKLLISPFDSTKYYYPGMYCYYDDEIYKCNTITHGTWTPSAWERVVFVDSVAGDYLEFTNNITNDYIEFTNNITNQESLFIAQLKAAIGGVAQYYNPDALYATGAYCTYMPNADIYDNETLYEAGDFCVYEKTLYECTQTTIGDFNIGAWVVSGVMYKCINETTGQFDSDDWQPVIIVNELAD